MADVAIPCRACGAELYDRVRKYRMDDGSLSKGSYCPDCNANQHDPDAPGMAEEARILFGDNS